MKQLIVRVEASIIRKLKVIAAQDNVSMAETVRAVLDAYIELRRQNPAVKKAFEAARLE